MYKRLFEHVLFDFTVLGQITQPLEGANVTIIDHANFSCSINGSEVLWTINGEHYEICTDGENREKICFTNENTGFQVISTLFISQRGAYDLGIGSYTVNCTVSNMVNESFRNDESFDPKFEQLIVTESSSAVLTITATGE